MYFPRTCLSGLEEFNRAIAAQITVGEVAVMVAETHKTLGHLALPMSFTTSATICV